MCWMRSGDKTKLVLSAPNGLSSWVTWDRTRTIYTQQRCPLSLSLQSLNLSSSPCSLSCQAYLNCIVSSMAGIQGHMTVYVASSCLFNGCYTRSHDSVRYFILSLQRLVYKVTWQCTLLHFVSSTVGIQGHMTVYVASSCLFNGWYTRSHDSVRCFILSLQWSQGHMTVYVASSASTSMVCCSCHMYTKCMMTSFVVNMHYICTYSLCSLIPMPECIQSEWPGNEANIPTPYMEIVNLIKEWFWTRGYPIYIQNQILYKICTCQQWTCLQTKVWF